jgi:hypothetical protein
MFFLQEVVARIKMKEAIENGLESQRIHRYLLKNSRTPYAQNAIKAFASFARTLFNWVSQLPCEFRKRFALSKNAGFSECG